MSEALRNFRDCVDRPLAVGSFLSYVIRHGSTQGIRFAIVVAQENPREVFYHTRHKNLKIIAAEPHWSSRKEPWELVAGGRVLTLTSEITVVWMPTEYVPAMIRALLEDALHGKA
jgi:hypothetical protein